MRCDRYGRKLCNVPPEEMKVCKAEGLDCFSCGYLHYDLDGLDFEDADSWPPEEPDPWEGGAGAALDGYNAKPIADEMAADVQELKARLLKACREVGASAEKVGEVMAEYCALMQEAAEIARKTMETAIETLCSAFEEVSKAADWDELKEMLQEIAWEDEDRETMRPEKRTEEPHPLLLRSCSLRVLYSQGFDPGPVRR